MRRRLFAALLLLPVVAAGCGSGAARTDAKSKPPPGTSRSVTIPQDTVRGCHSLGSSEVGRVSGRASIHVRDLAPGPQLRCSTVFFGDLGEVIVTLSERTGGAAALRGVRSTSVEQFGAQSVRPVRALGAGAFVAKRRLLAFRRGDRVITLETGYDPQGRLALSVGALAALARIAR